MKECKTCIHRDVCGKAKNPENYRISGCEHYKDESQYIKLPMPAADWLKAELTEHCRERCFEEL